MTSAPPERSPTSGRRVLSRISSPFTSKSRNVAEFSIEPDDAHKQYSPGDIVTGHVRLRVAKPIRITHITVCLHGFVQVYKNPGSPGGGYRGNNAHVGTGRGKKSGEYFGNGFASLFEDEAVLCGDGRLAEGAYHFKFELEFPDRDLPSSIDFERGTISYMITASMTRQNSMSPPISCDRKVYLLERIDISPLYPPTAREIKLAPILKRTLKDQARKLVDSSDKSRNTNSTHQGGSSDDAPRQSDASSALSTRPDSQKPVSPVPSESELSFDSRVSQRRASQQESQQRTSSASSESGKTNSNQGSPPNKVIVARIESQAGGCLRGDHIPIKVNISHTKHVRSMYGVIVTLFRQARVDMRPDIPLGPVEKGKEGKFEDYYPKSVTGLGGLSLSGAGSSHVFRKDLSQVMVPLMVDPQSLAAEVHAKVRVPDEVFPTISTVPGSMISFKYYVEVIVDIQGKLHGQDKNLNNPAGQGAPAGLNTTADGSHTERSAFTPFGSTIVDTTSVIRDKGVVSCSFEVVIGTKDSERKRGKRKMIEAVETKPELPQPQRDIPEPNMGAQPGADWYANDSYHGHYWYDERYGYNYSPDQYPSDHYQPAYNERDYQQPPPPLPPVPIPQIPDESQMTEKQRVQQAESRLLPSQPPDFEAQDGVAGATAPFLPEEIPRYEHTESAFALPTSSNTETEQHRISAPEYAPPIAGSSAQAVGDDKMELERQRHQAQASAPPLDEDEDNESSAVLPEERPSAPTLEEIDREPQEHDSHAEAAGTSGLPRYE